MQDFKVTLTISEQDIIDVLVAAVEGGSHYWADDMLPLHATESDFYKDCAKHGFNIFDKHENQEYTISPERIRQGLTIMAEAYGSHFSDLVRGEFDATTGDVLLQCIVLEDVIYG